MTDGPLLPDALERHRDTSAGRMRSRSVGEPSPGVPEVVLVQGMAVADYLMPAVAELGRWTRAHLVELPGFAGSGEPTRTLDVPGYAGAVVEWLDAAQLGPVVLASPTVAPVARPLPRMVLRWRLDGKHEPPGLTGSHLHEWRRAGVRGLLHLVRVHLRDRIEESVPAVAVPLLVIRGADDRLSTPEWARGLAASAPRGRYQEVPGAHTFLWADPGSWSAPVRQLARDVA